MGYSVYYNGEIDISPELSDEHATLLDEALTKSNPALLGTSALSKTDPPILSKSDPGILN